MRRAWIVTALWAVAGCFSDVESVPCPEGTEMCACVELQCEQGLVCQDARCVPEAGTDGTGSTSLTPTTTGETTASSTTLPTSATTAADTSTTNPESTESGASTSSTGGSSTTGPVCGDGVVDGSEVCDGTPGCTDCALDNYACNPLNNAPCGDGFKCSLFNDAGGLAATECRVALQPPGQLYESNCFNFELQDEWCDVGLSCVTSQSTDACDVNCCVEYCDRLDPTFECGFEGDMCLQALGDQAPTGLQWLGVCVTP